MPLQDRTAQLAPSQYYCKILNQEKSARGKLFAIGLAISLFGPWSAQSARIYVAGSSTNTIQDGTTWQTAYHDLIAAVQGVGAPAQSGDEVWVAKGTYFLNGLNPKGGIALYGGFKGTESDRPERRLGENETILRPTISGTGSLTVILGATLGATRFDGFTITRSKTRAIECTAKGPATITIANNRIIQNGDFGGFYPGGISCLAGQIVITNNFIAGNRGGDGGGIFAGRGTTILVANNTIIANSAITGGGILCEGTGSISNNWVSQNYSYHGGGIACFGTNISILQNRVLWNVVRPYASIPYGGGGIGCWGSQAMPLIANNVIAFNEVLADAGGEPGGGISSMNQSRRTLINNTVVYNRSVVGANIFSDGSQLSFTNNILAFGNTPPVFGTNAVFQNNCIFEKGFPSTPELAGAHNLFLDPGLVLKTNYAWVRLDPGSSCRDAGDNTVALGDFDALGQTRVVNGTVDIGAIEFDPDKIDLPPRIFRVSPAGSDDADGTSWQAPMKTIQAALKKAGDEPAEFWIREGFYTENLTLGRFSSLYGGFAGTEISREPRDPRTHRTVIDGGQNGSVITADYVAPGTVIDGLTPQHGFSETGGGITTFCAGPIISRCLVLSNSAPLGGGIFLATQRPDYPNTTQLLYPFRATISDTMLWGNISDSGALALGGGIYCRSILATILYSLIIANQCKEDPFGYGSGIYLNEADTQLINNTIVGNSSPISFPPTGAITNAQNVSNDCQQYRRFQLIRHRSSESRDVCYANCFL